MPAGRPSAELRPCLRPRAGYDATDDKGHYHLNVYCEDVDDEAYHADPAVDQWWGDSEACDCSCYSGEADSNNYYNNYYNYYNGYEYEYDSAAYMCVDDFQNFDPRCDWSCAHAGPYCYDGGSDNHGCNEWSNDEAGPCCVSGAPTVTPAPSPMPMPDYAPVYEQGCNNYIHMDGGYYGTSEYMWGGSFSLEQCAAAVWWYDGIDGCMGDYFYYEYGWDDGHGSCACEYVLAPVSRARPHLHPRPPPRVRPRRATRQLPDRQLLALLHELERRRRWPAVPIHRRIERAVAHARAHGRLPTRQIALGQVRLRDGEQARVPRMLRGLRRQRCSRVHRQLRGERGHQ